MDYGEVLTRAWHVIWKHKILWIFGIFTGLAGQASGGVQNLFSGTPRFQYNFNFEDFSRGKVPPFLPELEGYFNRFFESMPVWFWVVLGISLILLAIGLWVLSIYGRAGLVHGAVKGDEDRPFTFGSLFKEGSHYFLRLFLLDLVLMAGGLVLSTLAVLGLAAVGIFTLGIGLIFMIPLLCLVIPLSFLVGIYLTQVQVALVAEDLDLWQAFGRAWRVVIDRPGEMIVMGLILMVIGLAAGLLLGLPFGMALAPLGISLFGGGALNSTLVTASMIFGLILLPFAILGSGILTAYTYGTWTLTFRRLTGRKAGAPAAETAVAPIAPIAPAAPVAPEAPGEFPPDA